MDKKTITVIEVILALLREVAKIADKLKSGEIKPEQVDIKGWNRKLKSKTPLPE